MKKCHQNRGVPQNAYSLKLKSITRTILYKIYSTKHTILGFFLLFNFQVDSALTFSSGLIEFNIEMKDKSELKDFLKADAANFKSQNYSWLRRFKYNVFSNPISDQKYIWLYIKALRYVEYYQSNTGSIVNKILMLWWLRCLRKYSHITGFQIPPNVCERGLTIWHWGAIIINPAAKIGKNCTLYPGVLIGHKYSGSGAAVIGDNVFIGAGTKIIGPVKIGNNVTIGQNCVITKDIPANSVVVCNNENRILK